MRLLRSWPRVVPPDRSHVIDDIERLVIGDFDYRRLGALKDDVLLLEWDIAVDPEHLAEFIEQVELSPGRVRVAPYRLYYQYPDSVWNDHKPAAVWAHRRVDRPGAVRWVTADDTTCHFFGFGCVYLPRDLIAGYCAGNAGPLGDDSFSKWHYRHAPDPDVVIDWNCRPIHLHHPSLKEAAHGGSALHRTLRVQR